MYFKFLQKIHKVEKQLALTDNVEPVSQLHKCALYIKGTDCEYLSLHHNQIVVFKVWKQF